MAAAHLASVVSLFDQLKKCYDAGETKADEAIAMLAKLKIAMLSFTSLVSGQSGGHTKPRTLCESAASADACDVCACARYVQPHAMAAAPSPVDRVLVHEELLVAREILEHGALLSIRQMDIPAFERYVAQLKVYYSDASILTPSQRQFPILGLNLLRLLAQNRIAEFHTELELIPTELQHANIYIKYPAQLEQHIMEGSYHKVLYFMDMLVDTVREEIAECSEKAYTSIAASELQSMLMLTSGEALAEFVEQRGWRLDGKTVAFSKAEEEQPTQKLPSAQLIQETLSYAKELERIV
ncbi:26s proteasome non-ATPase regulatory subunit 8 [Chrysochromulina tobinii]|uniref:26s proteasome non-ATPase regulatory subunit 8 n=1 Tax=Chrysochromulina tobinii TaxID=1460289 RepID=A0A0M0JAY1_9EUKA|nr:26s proteasome non-ATPase regulatory subunit 8 [Chrysochromulina tobinii]|eukprot:KOO23497.1 26s proteasome non-ATPase regulatory subunit 8 [Chrysochromulina sp. CCMP291]